MKADPRGKRKLTVEEWHDVFNKSDAGGYVKLTYGTILEFEDSVRRAALASQPSGQPVTSAPSPIWPESPCRVCGKPTIDEGGYCSDECLEKSEPIKSPSDLKAKLESLRKSIRSNYECNHKDGHTETADAQEAIYYELTAILEGKD